jgi:hypothetical protein
MTTQVISSGACCTALPPFLAAAKTAAIDRRSRQAEEEAAKRAEYWKNLLAALREEVGDELYAVLMSDGEAPPGNFTAHTSSHWFWLKIPGHRPIVTEFRRSGSRWSNAAQYGRIWFVARSDGYDEGPYDLGDALVTAEFKDESEETAWSSWPDELDDRPF